MKGIVENLTHDLEKDLERVSDELNNEIVRAERELELEHAQIKSLVGNENPQIVEQMEAMEDSISRLYHGLEKATMYIQLAQGESYILRQQMRNQITTQSPDRALTTAG